jgi:hypothetical protein
VLSITRYRGDLSTISTPMGALTVAVKAVNHEVPMVTLEVQKPGGEPRTFDCAINDIVDLTIADTEVRILVRRIERGRTMISIKAPRDWPIR